MSINRSEKFPYWYNVTSKQINIGYPFLRMFINNSLMTLTSTDTWWSSGIIHDIIQLRERERKENSIKNVCWFIQVISQDLLLEIKAFLYGCWKIIPSFHQWNLSELIRQLILTLYDISQWSSDVLQIFYWCKCHKRTMIIKISSVCFIWLACNEEEKGILRTNEDYCWTLFLMIELIIMKDRLSKFFLVRSINE